MGVSVRCPVCGGEIRGRLLREWVFRFYRVRRFECERCGAKFNFYEGPKSKFTIPKARG
ncbi:hypothetical protein KEJ42_00100 [Candidatus Bathyarchaeota archaeon]|nr:hypothetical protein [Candidatus Bathyarchaeota archaeon]